MRLAVSKNSKTILRSKIVGTPESFKDGITLFKETAKELSKGEKIDKCVGCIAGLLDKKGEKIINSPNKKEWSGKPLKNSLEKAIGVPVKILNDTVAAGLGEAVFGKGKRFNIVAYLTVSTGVGGARIAYKNIGKGLIGFEPGHQIIAPEGLFCGCRGKGHLEAYISGTAFQNRYGRDAENIKDPKIWNEAAQNLAVGLNNVIVFWTPDVIILGGSMMLGKSHISIPLVKDYLKKMETIFPKIPPIIKASLGDETGLYGALAYLKANRLSEKTRADLHS